MKGNYVTNIDNVLAEIEKILEATKELQKAVDDLNEPSA